MKTGDTVRYLMNGKRGRNTQSGEVVKVNTKTFWVRCSKCIINRKKERDLVN